MKTSLSERDREILETKVAEDFVDDVLFNRPDTGQGLSVIVKLRGKATLAEAEETVVERIRGVRHYDDIDKENAIIFFRRLAEAETARLLAEREKEELEKLLGLAESPPTERILRELLDCEHEFDDPPDLLVEVLKKPGIDIEEKDEDGVSLLSRFCLGAYLHPTKNVAKVIGIMLGAGADVNARCVDGYSPLRYLAISFTYEPTEDMPDQPELEDAVWDLFDMLIKAGANPVAAEIADNPDIAPAIRAYIEAWIIGGKPPRERTKSRGIRDV